MKPQKLKRDTNIFLSNNFPENIKPIQKLTKNGEKILDKTVRLRRLDRIAKQAQNLIINQTLLPFKLQQKKNNLIKNFEVDTPFFQSTSRNLFAFLFNKSRLDVNNTRGKKALTLLKKRNKKISFLFSFHQLKLLLDQKRRILRQPRFGDFKSRLFERKKLSFFYGYLKKRQLQKTLQQARKSQARTEEKFLSLLESRLDIAVFRVFLFKSIPSARQFITHGNVLVNGEIVKRPGLLLSPGDTITFISNKKNQVKNK